MKAVDKIAVFVLVIFVAWSVAYVLTFAMMPRTP
jgi:hypothetical protein